MGPTAYSETPGRLLRLRYIPSLELRPVCRATEQEVRMSADRRRNRFEVRLPRRLVQQGEASSENSCMPRLLFFRSAKWPDLGEPSSDDPCQARHLSPMADRLP